MAAHVQDTTFVPRRIVVLIGIVLLHVLLAYGLATGLARRAMEIIAPPIQTNIIEEVQQHDLPPPPPPPEFERPPVECRRRISPLISPLSRPNPRRSGC